MFDEINNLSLDVVIPCLENKHEDKNNDKENLFIKLSDSKSNGRPLYQIKHAKYIDIIQQELKAKHYILSATYNTNAYYACPIAELQQKVFEHMTHTHAYHFVLELNQIDKYHTNGFLKSIDNQITTKLNMMLYDKLITMQQWKKLIYNPSTSRIDFLYFLPDTRQENVPFLPMINANHRLTKNISRFLIHLLQPIYDYVTYSKTFHTSIDLIQALEKYRNTGNLQSKTLFATLHIQDLSFTISHEYLCNILKRFLDEYLPHSQIESITIATILDLVQLVLANQYVLYGNKLYQMIQGGACNTPLTILLTNIHIYYWQQDFVTLLNNENEIFGRYFDEIFFTWNKSQEQLHDIIHTMNRQQPNVQFTLAMNENIDYLDVNVQQQNGEFMLKVAHNLNIEPYALPYVFGYPCDNYDTYFRAILLHATRCYTNVHDFANELEHIQLSFQYNRFSDDFIKEKIQSFFNEFGGSTFKVHFDQEYCGQSLYNHLHENVYKYYQRSKMAKIKRSRRLFNQRRKFSQNKKHLLPIPINLISSRD